MNKRDVYFERQHSRYMLVIIPLIFIALIATCFLDSGMVMDDKIAAITLIGVMMLIIILFIYKMDIVADQYGIKVSLGVGIVKKTIYFDQIESVSVTSLRGKNLTAVGVDPFLGLASSGIADRWNVKRRTMFFNTNMRRHGVAVFTKGDKQQYYLIGTNRPEELAKFLQDRMLQND